MRLSLSHRTLFYHILAWGIYIFYELSIVILLNQNRGNKWEYIGYFTLNICLFYANAFIALSRAVRTKKKLYLLAFLIPIELIVYIFLQVGLEHIYSLLNTTRQVLVVDMTFILRCIWRGFYFVILSTTYWLIKDTIATNRRISELKIHQLTMANDKAELENKLVRSQNAYLQAQINPHFLFNTLNFIYNSVYEVSSKASESLMLLSEILHFALDKVGEDGKTPLSLEVEHIKKYVSLNLLRYEQPMSLSMQFHGTFNPYRIPPLILLTFIENMFKHGDLTATEMPTVLKLTCKDGLLSFYAKNKKKVMLSKSGTGIGLQNIEERLKCFYKEQHYELQVKQDKDYYSVSLQLNLTQPMLINT